MHSIRTAGQPERRASDKPTTMHTINDPVLSVKHLKTRFHTAEGTVFAVNDVSFDLHDKETLAVVGESGCGKSVTMMSILGLIPIPPGEIAAGEACYFGRDLLKSSERELESIRGKEIAMVFQDPMTSLNPVLSIGHQITESLRYHLGMNQEEANYRAVEMLELVGIPDPSSRLNAYPHQFSGGMRQRVMIAMALACSPNVLIADEPTTALDVTIQAQITELVYEFRQRLSMSIIWITHDLGVVAGLADRVVVMYAGYIVEEAPVFDLYEHPHHPYTVALLAALPRVDLRREHHLASIPGAPPNLLVEPVGCPFSARCPVVFERCIVERPPLFITGNGHQSACWLDPATGKPR